MKKTIGIALLTGCFILSGCQKKMDTVSESEKQIKYAKASEFNVQLGLAYLKQGDRGRAKIKLMTALEESPKSSKAHGALAYFFEKTGDIARAQQFYLKSIALAKSKGASLNNYGAYLCRRKQYIKANEFFVKASQDLSYLNTSGALENAGLCSLEIPDKSMAKFYFKKALEQDPKRYQSTYQLAKMAMDEKRYKDVISQVKSFEGTGSITPELSWLGFQASKHLGNKKVANSYAWMLKERFSKSKQYQKLLASNQYDGSKRT